MRNLNGRELHGRNLRVDHATRDHGVDQKVGSSIQTQHDEYNVTVDEGSI